MTLKVGDKVIYVGKQTDMLTGATGIISSNIHSETVNITWDDDLLNHAFGNVQIKKSNLQLYAPDPAPIKEQYVARKTLHMSMGRCTNDYL